MPSDLVLWETSGAITRLTLNRPRAMNALSRELAAQFKTAVARISREKSKVVVVTGKGAFSAGGDLDFIRENTRLPRSLLTRRMRDFYASFLALRDLPQATIAQINGSAVGAGLCLALACDLRTVLSSAKLALNFVRLGLNPGMAAWPLARAAFGDNRARELLFTGRFFTGRELHKWGAAVEMGEDSDDLESRTQALARQIASQSGPALRLLKEELRREDLRAFLELEAKGQAASFKRPDILEGVAAIREGRPPKF